MAASSDSSCRRVAPKKSKFHAALAPAASALAGSPVYLPERVAEAEARQGGPKTARISPAGGARLAQQRFGHFTSRLVRSAALTNSVSLGS